MTTFLLALALLSGIAVLVVWKSAKDAMNTIALVSGVLFGLSSTVLVTTWIA